MIGLRRICSRTSQLWAGRIALAASFCSAHAIASVRVLVDQVGYEPQAAKLALVVATEGEPGPGNFSLINVDSGKTVLDRPLGAAGGVQDWRGMVFWSADFSDWHEPGRYVVRITSAGGRVTSCPFTIESEVLERQTLSNVLYYFKGQRASGDFDRADRHLAIPDEPGKFVDAHGGWYDATGDYGIHLSHQNLTSYFNPQQVPLVAWSLLASYRVLEGRGDDNFTEYRRRMLDEGLYGADYLMRIKRRDGSFFESISAPGREKLAKDRVIGNPNWRTQIKTSTTDSTERLIDAAKPHTYESSFRAGGGMAIAALALASTMPEDGDFTREQYLRTSQDAFSFLSRHNRELLNDGLENIVDDYCVLMAATELYRASHEDQYRTIASARAKSLMARLTTTGKWHDYWRADAKTRPFFHPSDAGLPVISLINYYRVAAPEEQQSIRGAVQRSLQFELAATGEVNNPFGYARQLVRMGDGRVRTAFFFPHDTEAAPWWQGEDARLASLAAAARMAIPLFSDAPEFQLKLANYAWNQLHWILGRNPFDVSLLIGSGHGDASYMFFRSYKYTNAPGAIVNGITASAESEDGIAFNQGFAATGKDEDWRWTEGWLPHAAWYLYAVSLPSR
ncbi:MAG TPA: glycoside hydrolase family 9 protein [Terracidiphilus sp.]